MTLQRKSAALPFALALVSLAISAFCLLWAISSFSMSFADCQGVHTLSAARFRCQRPMLLQLGFLLSGTAGLAFAFWAALRWYPNRRVA